MTFTVYADVWRHPGGAGWHFVTLPTEVADEVRARAEGQHRPFGSLPIEARIGTTSWTTSLFADTKSGSYLLPLKADTRRRARVEEGDTVTVSIALV
jgi:hypothetical protein